jgi:hypothetical protein
VGELHKRSNQIDRFPPQRTGQKCIVVLDFRRSFVTEASRPLTKYVLVEDLHSYGVVTRQSLTPKPHMMDGEKYIHRLHSFRDIGVMTLFLSVVNCSRPEASSPKGTIHSPPESTSNLFFM